LKRGGEIYDALEASGAPFPPDFRESIMVAEETGQMTEVWRAAGEPTTAKRASGG